MFPTQILVSKERIFSVYSFRKEWVNDRLFLFWVILLVRICELTWNLFGSKGLWVLKNVYFRSMLNYQLSPRNLWLLVIYFINWWNWWVDCLITKIIRFNYSLYGKLSFFWHTLLLVLLIWWPLRRALIFNSTFAPRLHH